MKNFRKPASKNVKKECTLHVYNFFLLWLIFSVTFSAFNGNRLASLFPLFLNTSRVHLPSHWQLLVGGTSVDNWVCAAGINCVIRRTNGRTERTIAADSHSQSCEKSGVSSSLLCFMTWSCELRAFRCNKMTILPTSGARRHAVETASLSFISSLPTS